MNRLDSNAHADPSASEGEWVYVSGPLQVADRRQAVELYETIAQSCEEIGWHTVCPYRELVDDDFELVLEETSVAPLGHRLQQAVAEADACVMYVGLPSTGVGAELAFACTSGRPVIAVHLENEQPSPMVLSLLATHNHAQVVVCADSEQVPAKVREALRSSMLALI